MLSSSIAVYQSFIISGNDKAGTILYERYASTITWMSL